MKKIGKTTKLIVALCVCAVIVGSLLGGGLFLAGKYGVGALNRHDRTAYADAALLTYRAPFRSDYIWIEEDGVAVWAAFSKDIELDADADATLDISCDTYYWLWVNGEEIVWEGSLKRGITPTDGYYDHVEIEGKVHRGRNNVSILVRHLGDDGYSHKDSGRGGLVVEGFVGDRPFGTDSSWKATRYAYRYSAWDFLQNLNFRLPERGSKVDGEAYCAFWQGYAPEEWDNAVVIDKETARQTFGRCYLNPLPPKTVGDVVYFDAEPVTFDRRTTLTFRLDVNRQFCPYFEIEADKKGRRITYYTENRKLNYKNTYTAKKGDNAFLDFAWINGETFVVTFDKGITLKRVGYRPTAYGAQSVQAFRCDDDALTTLWQKAANTLMVTMRDTYMDCPDRERAQWIGDAVIESEMSVYCLTPESAALFRKAILSTYGWVHADGALQTVVPDGTDAYELPVQNLAFLVGCVGYVEHTGDRSVVPMILSMAEGYLPLWQMQDGLVRHRKGSWDWGDWGQHVDMEALENAWYYLALSRLATLAPEGSALARLAAERLPLIAEAYASFYTAEGIAGGRRADDRANAVAVLAGLYRKEDAAAIIDTLYTVRNSSPYMEKYVEQSLCVLGRTDLALARAKEVYADMRADECSTLWEFWAKGNGTTNHAWAGGTLYVLSRYVGGVYPTSDGFASFVVRPDLDCLQNFSVSLNPVAGVEIEVEAMRLADGRRRVVVTCSSEGGTLVVTGRNCVYNGEPVQSAQATERSFPLSVGVNVLELE